jgi:hypothetical protein
MEILTLCPEKLYDVHQLKKNEVSMRLTSFKLRNHKNSETKQDKFRVIEAFAELDPNRKMILCDRLFSNGYDSYSKMVNLLWPQSSAQDIKKLEKFLILLKNTAH